MFGTSFVRHVTNTAARGGALTSVTVWGWSAPFLVVGLLFTELASIGGVEDIALVILVGALSHLALGAVMWGARVTVLLRKNRDSAGPLKVLSVLALAGVIRGAVITDGYEFFGAGNDAPWWVRILTSVLLITVSFLYAAYAVQLWRDYVERRGQLLATIVTNESAIGRQEIATSAYRDLVFQGVEEDIQAAKEQTATAIDTITKRIESGGISPEELEKLFGQSDKAWRDASHRAWEGSNPDIPRITARELVITLLGSKPMALTVFVFGAIFGLFRVLAPDLGVVASLPIMGVFLAGQLVIAGLMNLLSRFGAPWNQMSFGAGMLVMMVWPGVVAVWWELPPILVLSMIWLGVVAVFFSLFVGLPIALGKSGEAVLAQLERRVDDSALAQLRTQGEMFVLAQKIGAYLHGPLRSQFLQLSMELRSALEKADPFDVADALSRLRQVVHGLEHRVDTAPDISEFLDNWRALIHIDTNIDEIHIPERIKTEVTTVVTEAVNNAIRHGNASQVGVFFRYRPDGLLVEVIGAPVGSADPGEAGLGAHILNDIAPGMWFSDVTEDGRYRLRVTVKTTGQ
jgi:hypothetical protein